MQVKSPTCGCSRQCPLVLPRLCLDRSCGCRWDVFPGIKLSDAKARRNVGVPETPQPSGEKQDSQSPRGPLSAVDSSDFESTTRSSGMEAELSRTFDLQDLEVGE